MDNYLKQSLAFVYYGLIINKTKKKKHWGYKHVLLARNLTLNSDAAPKYKRMFVPHISPKKHQWNTYNHKCCKEKESKGLSDEVRTQATNSPVSILNKSKAGCYRPVRVADGPITARYIFIKNACWEDHFAHCKHWQSRIRRQKKKKKYIYIYIYI